MTKEGVCDFRGVKSGKYDRYLGNFNYKEGYSDKEWKTLHPMIKRKKFVESRGDKNKKRSAKEVHIEELELLKSAHAHDVVRIASLKRKLDREIRKKYDARGKNYSDDEDILGSDEDPSVLTDADSMSSGVSVRNGLKKTGKRARFKKPVHEEV